MKKNEGQPRGWAKLFVSIALGFVAFIIQALIVVVANITLGLEFASLELLAVSELGAGVCALLFVAMLGGSFYAKPSLRGFGFALRVMAVVIVLDVIILVLSMVGVFAELDGKPFPDGWLANLGITTLLCLGVGMFEEGVFRGLLLQGLLARMGTSKGGIVAAVLISSLVFGLVHVVPTSDTGFDTLAIAQMILKTLQAGMLGAMLAIIVIKTHSLWGAIFIHGATDWLLMAPTTAILEEPLPTEYVFDGELGVQLVVVYAVICVLYLPSLIASLRALKTVQAPHRGALYRMRTPQQHANQPQAPLGDAPCTTAVHQFTTQDDQEGFGYTPDVTPGEWKE